MDHPWRKNLSDLFWSEIFIVNQSEKEATNPRYIQVTLSNTKKGSLGLTNEGFRGMGIKKGLRYDFSVLYRQKTANAKIHVELVSEKGDIIGSGIFIPG